MHIQVRVPHIFHLNTQLGKLSVVGQFEIGHGRRGQSSRWVRSMSARARSLSACNVSKHCIQKLSPTPMRENDGSSPSPNGAGCAFIIAGGKQKHTPVFPARCPKIVKLFRVEGENNKSSQHPSYRQCWFGLAIRSEDGTIHPFRAEGAKLHGLRLRYHPTGIILVRFLILLLLVCLKLLNLTQVLHQARISF
jgi:hypothetical protein